MSSTVAAIKRLSRNLAPKEKQTNRTIQRKLDYLSENDSKPTFFLLLLLSVLNFSLGMLATHNRMSTLSDCEKIAWI